MPKYGIHHLVLDSVINKMDNVPAAEMKANYPYANLGAIGPDVFFWSPEYKEFNIFLDIYRGFAELRQLYERLAAPIEQLEGVVTDAIIGEIFSEPVQEDINALLDEKQEIRSRISQILTQSIPGLIGAGLNLATNPAGLVSPTALIFEFFRPKFQQGNEDERGWLWFEMLHYRRTGRFAEELVKLARRGSAGQRAYAYGYLSHVATDVVGHAFVNQVVGGPYRLHVQRHVTVENFMDTWAFNEFKQQPISSTLMSALQLDSLRAVPDEIVNMIERALGRAFDDSPHPKYLLSRQIHQAFANMLDVMRLMEQSVVPAPEIFLCDVEAELLELLERNFPPPPPPPELVAMCSAEDIFAFGTTERSRRCYDSFFHELEKWIEYLGQIAAWLDQTIQNTATFLQDVLATVTVCGLRMLLSRLDWLMYELYLVTREALAQLGFIYPEPPLLATALGRELVSTNASETFGCYSRISETKYPRYTDLKHSHLIYPRSIFESPPTVPNFDGRGESIRPDSFMFGRPTTEFSEDHLDLYANAASPREADGYALAPCHRIGDAAGFTTWLIEVAAGQSVGSPQWKRAFTNWNLDSDRGYGYKTWQGTVANPPDDEHVMTDLVDDSYGKC